MGTRIACLFLLTALSVCQAEEVPPCDCFEDGVYTTVKSLNFSEATYCIGWSDAILTPWCGVEFIWEVGCHH